MPRFYFHLYDVARFLDEEGQELSDGTAAIAVALSGARELACAEIMRGGLDPGHRIDVVDEAGEIVGTITFGEAAGLASGPDDFA